MRDVRMVERSEQFCFALESDRAIGIARKAVW